MNGRQLPEKKRAGPEIPQLELKAPVSQEVRRGLERALISPQGFREYIQSNKLDRFGEDSAKLLETAAAAYDVLRKRSPRPYKDYRDRTDVGLMAEDAISLLSYSRTTDAVPVMLALSTLHDRQEIFSALSRIRSLRMLNDWAKTYAHTSEPRPFDDPQYESAWLTIAKKFGTAGRGDFFHAIRRNFVSSGLMSSPILETIFTKSIEKKLIAGETYTSVYDRFKSTAPDRQAYFFRSDFWLSLTRSERLPVLRGFLSSPSRNYEELYPIFYERWRWRSFIPDKDWNELLTSFGAQEPDRALYLLWDNEQRLQDDEIPIAKKWFTEARFPQTRVDFLQKGLSLGDSRLYDEFARLVLDTRPAELLVLQNAKPKVAPLDSHPVRTGMVDTIFQDRALAGIAAIKTEQLPADIQSLSPVEIAHWKAWVARNLYFAGTPATEAITKEVIAEGVKDIQDARARIGPMPIFKGADVIVGMHEELRKSGAEKGQPRFARPDFIAGLKRQAAHVDVISPHLDLKKKDYRVTPDSLKRAKEDILNRIVTCGSPSTFCVFFPEMHGGTEHEGQGGSIFLSDGQVNNIIEEPDKPRQVVRTERTLELTAQEIASAYLKRYSNPEKRANALLRPDWIVFASCVSSNIGRRIADLIREQGVVPPHMLFMSEWGQPGFSEYYNPIGHDFGSATLGLGEKDPVVTTVQRVIERSPRQYKSRPGILIPKILDGKPVRGRNGRPTLMQIGNLFDGTRAAG